MTDKERYEMLKDSLKKGANIAPVDFDFINEYEMDDFASCSNCAGEGYVQNPDKLFYGWKDEILCRDCKGSGLYKDTFSYKVRHGIIT